MPMFFFNEGKLSQRGFYSVNKPNNYGLEIKRANPGRIFFLFLGFIIFIAAMFSFFIEKPNRSIGFGILFLIMSLSFIAMAEHPSAKINRVSLEPLMNSKKFIELIAKNINVSESEAEKLLDETFIRSN